MPYALGIDIGNTSVVAAVAHRRDGGWGRPEVVALGPGSARLSSARLLSALLSPESAVTPGDEGDADCAVQNVLSRVGDDVQAVLHGVPYPPQTLVALLAADVVERVRQATGATAEAIVFSHPAGWGRHRRELLRRALWERGVGEVTLLPRTITVAEGHAARGVEGDLVAVYALGGATFETALVRRNSRGRFETVGVPQGLPGLGGTYFDEALAEHVRIVLARELAATGAAARATLRALPISCEQAKQRLTVDPTADVELCLPTGPVRVPVTRLQFEELIRPAVRATVESLLCVVHAAGLTPSRLDGVLLTGGASRVPLVAELLAAAGLSVETAPDPQVTDALGAAVAAAEILMPRPLPAGPPAVAAGVARAAAAPQPPPRDDRPRDEPPPRPPVRFTPLDLPKSRRRLARSRGREG
ncbi:hypothetical protein Vqi01_03490 [Micromonospora qiuiae]|uniref:Hsp70 family protein n=1 Tax=Micromonospora qiuiae TaxID=502268 RepID=A0ABQ4J500_9ACTN|nr:Hsp70 family protein [Micromonospora qiuiae]GIJ25187.1 hypothetical protein Vqi01_03490 [Micromonospora qiuiae]